MLSKKEVRRLIDTLKKDAFSLRRDIEHIKNRRKRERAYREYAKIISMIEEMEHPNPLFLVRYE